jgi:hypothetical protein
MSNQTADLIADNGKIAFLAAGGLLFVASTHRPALIRSIYARKASGSLDEIASHSESRV